MAAAEEDGPREELIRAAMRTITHGTQEIHVTFSQARGPLSKAVIRDLHRRVKDLRQTAESAEDAFRDWTVELSGRPYEKEAKLRYDELRASFEEEVSSIQHAMSRVADEVKRRQASKASQLPTEPAHFDISSGDLEEPAAAVPIHKPATYGAALPEIPRPPPRTPVVMVPSASSGSPAPPRRAPALSGEQAMVSSHSAVARTLQEMSVQDNHWANPSVSVISDGCKLDSGKADRRGMNPMMKYFLWAALLSLAYVIWVEARYLVSSIAHDDALRGARAGHRSSLGVPVIPVVRRPRDLR